MKKILNCTYSFMDNYAQHAGLSILSLFDNNKEADEINVYVIDYNIGDENHGKLEKVAAMYQRRIFFVNLELISKRWMYLQIFAEALMVSYSFHK